MTDDPRLPALPDIHGHAKGEHKPFADERPIPYSARLMFLWFYHAARRGSPRFMMVTDHINYLTFEDPAAVNLVRRALRLALAGDLYGTAETAGVDIAQATTVSEALRSGMRFTIGAEVDNDPRSRPDAPNVVDAMRPDGIIRSIHFLPIPQPGNAEDFMWPFDNPEFIRYYDEVGVERVWAQYIDLLADAIATLPTHIVGHLYVPGKFGHWPDDTLLQGYEDRIIEICKERNIAIEFNSRIFYRTQDEALKAKHIELYSRLLRKCKEHDIGVALGSDAHSPKDQGRGFDILLPLIDAAEINEIVFPINGQHARVALRVDKIKQRVPKPLPPVRAQQEEFVGGYELSAALDAETTDLNLAAEIGEDRSAQDVSAEILAHAAPAAAEPATAASESVLAPPKPPISLEAEPALAPSERNIGSTTSIYAPARKAKPKSKAKTAAKSDPDTLAEDVHAQLMQMSENSAVQASVSGSIDFPIEAAAASDTPPAQAQETVPDRTAADSGLQDEVAAPQHETQNETAVNDSVQHALDELVAVEQTLNEEYADAASAEASSAPPPLPAAPRPKAKKPPTSKTAPKARSSAGVAASAATAKASPAAGTAKSSSKSTASKKPAVTKPAASSTATPAKAAAGSSAAAKATSAKSSTSARPSKKPVTKAKAAPKAAAAGAASPAAAKKKPAARKAAKPASK